MIKDVLGSPGFKHFFSINNLMFVFSYFNYILLHRQECHIPVIQAHHLFATTCLNITVMNELGTKHVNSLSAIYEFLVCQFSLTQPVPV